MAGGGSRGIHAARPTAHRLRSACTQVAFGGVWTIDVEEQNQNQKQKRKQKQKQKQKQKRKKAIRIPQFL
jgi:transcription initiation factor TFIID subunit TAF12